MGMDGYQERRGGRRLAEGSPQPDPARSAGNVQSLRPATYTKVDDLTPASWGHNLVLKVVSIAENVDKMYVKRNVAQLKEEMAAGAPLKAFLSMPAFDRKKREVLLGDETGTIVLRANEDQVDAFEGRDVVVVRNAFVKMTGGFMKLEFNQWGKVSAYPDGVKSTPAPPTNVNNDNNKSSVEYELVRVFDDDEDSA